MSNFRDLTDYLNALDFVEKDKFDAEQIGESELVPSMTAVDDFREICLLYREYYQAAFYFEGWVHPKELLMSHIIAWLLDKGGDREEEDLGFPTIEPLKNDDGSFDVIVTINFMDLVFVQRDDDGDLVINNKNYKRVELAYEIAELFELNHA